MMNTTAVQTALNDADLVAASITGDCHAFGQIVERYQNLICSIAYNATGNLSQSEDLAQETFIAAWKELRGLREPNKLRAWLCGIARNHANNALRRGRREATNAAEPLEAVRETVAHEPPAPEQVIGKEEEAILWRSLEQIPENYREPLILFYREQQSVGRVAEELELSEDAAKQRLSRGRKMLQEQVVAFVEGALTRSAPKKAFTIAVLAALPAFATTAASIGVVGASATKGLGALKSIAAFGVAGAAAGASWGWVGGVLGGVLGTCGGLLGIYLPTKIALAFAKSDKERGFIEKFARRMYRQAFAFVALTVFLTSLQVIFRNRGASFHLPLVIANLGSTLVFCIVCQVMAVRYSRGLRKIQQAQKGSVDPNAQLHLLLQKTPVKRLVVPRSYKSKLSLFGLPLVHVAIGGLVDGKMQRGIAKGWIAIGDIAVGVVLAIGGLAVGGIAFGGLTVGLISIAGAAFGVMAMGGGAAGVWAIGGLAVGGWAYGGGAIAWFAANGGLAIAHDCAMGGLAIAHNYAVGGSAIANHANDELARQTVNSYRFFPMGERIKDYLVVFSRWLLVLPALALIFGWRQWRKLKKEVGKAIALMVICAVPASFSCQPTLLAVEPTAESVTLTNGLRVAAVYFSGSTNVAIFTHLPMSLTSDGPRQSQWAHLIEHLVIRSTVPADSPMANAETLPDHMRLDFYGSTDNWQEGLKHAADWLRGVPFTQANLDAEKPKVNAECDFTTKNFVTHKFAMAAWAQGYRHNQNHAAVKGDILKATLAEIQKYRDERLVVLTNVVFCAVGGIEPAKLLPAFTQKLGAIQSSAKPVAPLKAHPGNREMTWDLDARHLVLTWPIPTLDHADYPALLAAAQWLNMQFFGDEGLKQLTGMTLAGADLATPEGNFFFVSASLRPVATFAAVREKIDRHLQPLTSGKGDLSLAPMIGKQLAESLTTLPDPATMKGQLPSNVTPAMLEMNIGLQWGMNEFRYGALKAALARKLNSENIEEVQGVARRSLSSKECSATTIRPF